MKRLSIKTQLTSFITTMLVMSVGVGAFIVVPTAFAIRTTRTELTQLQSFLETKYIEGQSRKESIERLGTVREQIGMFSNMTMKSGDELSIITQLEHIAERRSIEQELQVSYKEKHDPPPRDVVYKRTRRQKPHFVFSVTAQGTYTDLVDYLNEIERLPQYFIMDNLLWQKQKNKEGDEVITLRFDARIYETS